MPRWLRALLGASLGAALLSGLAWLLCQRLRPPTEGLELPGPWEPWLMRLHALAAWGFLFALGGVAASHVPWGWRRGLRRRSGAFLLLLGAACAGSGFAMAYLLPPPVRTVTGWVHAGLGAGLVGGSLWHRRRPSRNVPLLGRRMP